MAVDKNINEMINSSRLALQKLKSNPLDLDKGLKSQIDKIFLLKAEFGQFYDSEFFKFIKSTQQETSDEAINVKCLSWEILEFLLNLVQNGENLDIVIFNLFRILRLESKLVQQVNEVADITSSSGPLNLYRLVINRLLTCDHVDAELMALVTRHYIYNEVECSFCTSFILVEFLKVESNLSATRMQRILALLLNLPIPEPRKSATKNKAVRQTSSNEKDSKAHNNKSAATGEDSDDDSSIESFDDSAGEGSAKEHVPGPRPIYGYRKIYVKAWLSILLGNASIIPLSCMGSVLQHLTNGLLDVISNPMILADWISGHLDGEFAVLALCCIFQLITKHGLGQESCGETCSFYAKLYECTNEETLNGPYHTILLELLHESLKSFMLPVQFVKKFVKQLVRCACLVSSPSAAALLAIALNLLKAHHETCLDLVHKAGDDTVDTFQHPHSPTANNSSENLDTYLWEIPLLLRHHSEAVSRLAALFYSNFRAKAPFRITPRDFIGCDFDLYLSQHLIKAKRQIHQKSPFRGNAQKFTRQMTALYTSTCGY